jgi:hypothetical protein
MIGRRLPCAASSKQVLDSPPGLAPEGRQLFHSAYGHTALLGFLPSDRVGCAACVAVAGESATSPHCVERAAAKLAADPVERDVGPVADCVINKWLSQTRQRTFLRSRSNFARPYMLLLIDFNRDTAPFTAPELCSIVSPLTTAA